MLVHSVATCVVVLALAGPALVETVPMQVSLKQLEERLRIQSGA